MFTCLAFAQRFEMMDQGFFCLLLLAMQTKQAFAGLRCGAAQRFDARLGLLNLGGAGFRPGSKLFHAARETAGLFSKRGNRGLLRRAASFPLGRLRSGFRHFGGNLRTPRAKFGGALLVEGDAVLGAIDFQRRRVEDILILANLGVELVNALVEAVLFAFLLLNGLGVLGFRGGEFGELFGDALGFRIQLTRFSGKHLPNNAAHLVANFGVAACFGGLALQRAELLFHFHDDIVDAREIEL